MDMFSYYLKVVTWIFFSLLFSCFLVSTVTGIWMFAFLSEPVREIGFSSVNEIKNTVTYNLDLARWLHIKGHEYSMILLASYFTLALFSLLAFLFFTYFNLLTAINIILWSVFVICLLMVCATSGYMLPWGVQSFETARELILLSQYFGEDFDKWIIANIQTDQMALIHSASAFLLLVVTATHLYFVLGFFRHRF